MTASTGAKRWWRWCLSNHPVPGNNPVTGDLSWPSLLSSVSLYVLSLLVSLAGSFCSGTSGEFEQSLCTRLLLVSLYTIWSLWASPLLQLSSVTLARSPLTLAVFLSKSWAGTMRGCLSSELSCLTACSLWGSVQIEEDFPTASLRQALSLHGFFQFSPSLLLACLTPTTIFPSTPDSSGSMKGSGKKSRKKKKSQNTKNSLTGWPQRDGERSWVVIGLLCVLGTPIGGEEWWDGNNKHCFKQRAKDKNKKPRREKSTHKWLMTNSQAFPANQLQSSGRLEASNQCLQQNVYMILTWCWWGIL